MNLIRDFQTINIFGAQTFEAPIFLFSSAFIVIYAVLVYLVYSGINSLQSHKIKKLQREIVELKSELYNGQKDLLADIKNTYAEQLREFKTDNDQKLETLIKFNQYTLEKVIDETNGNFSRYRKETEKLLSEAKGGWWILKKLKIWK